MTSALSRADYETFRNRCTCLDVCVYKVTTKSHLVEDNTDFIRMKNVKDYSLCTETAEKQNELEF